MAEKNKKAQGEGKQQAHGLRRPPQAGGPRRVPAQPQAGAISSVSRSAVKKAMPYLIPGIATGGSIAAMFGLPDTFF